MERKQNKKRDESIKAVPLEDGIPKSEFMKLIHDTLKNPQTGMWSRKNITCFVSFMWAIIYSGYGLYSEKDIQEFVVIGFLSLSAGLLGLSSWEKKNL